MKKNVFLFLLAISFSNLGNAQVDQTKLGAWYMYFFSAKFKESSWGVQGDVQFRNWNLGGDLEQMLIRGGLTYSPKQTKIKFTLGYGDVTSGVYGTSNTTTRESRIYQEILYPVTIGQRFHLNHRIRYEQRFIAGQDLRTRYRYSLALNVGLNNKELVKKTLYLSLYDELFINGERSIGNGATVEVFDRNRFYLGLGYQCLDKLKIQLGLMNQTTDNWGKNQLQVSVFQNF